MMVVLSYTIAFIMLGLAVDTAYLFVAFALELVMFS